MQLLQRPKDFLVPSGSEIIFTVKDNSVITNVKGKYVAEVHIGTLGTVGSGTPACILKVNPNAKGIGIFDFSTIFDNYVSPDYQGGLVLSGGVSSATSTYNGLVYSQSTPHTIHQIDEYSTNRNSVRYFHIKFYTEYALSITDPVIEDQSMIIESGRHMFFNGYLDYTDVLKQVAFASFGGYGYDFDYHNWIMKDSADRFLTYAPTKQYIRQDDFHTMGFFNNLTISNSGYAIAPTTSNQILHKILVTYYYNGSSVFSAFSTNNTGTGGFNLTGADSNTHLCYVGVGTANFDGAPFAGSLPANWDYYTVVAMDTSGEYISQTYEFHQQYDDCKGFETIRLTWLNKWGTWDYYNFTKKSIRTINKKPLTYHSLEGTWNEGMYNIYGHKGGKRVLNNVANEEITVNSDWITDEESIWLEQLFTSADVFILNKKDANDLTQGYTRKYLEPVIVKSTTHIRKTKANDRLIQYSIDLEKSKVKRTHRV